MTHKKPSVCLVTCYRDPYYVRVKTLEAGLIANNVKLSIARNRQRGVLRYAEVILKLIKIRFSVNPDIYFVTFRGYEILPFVLLIGIGKKVVFDEFINLVEWTVYEHKKLKLGGVGDKLLRLVYGFLLKRTAKILTDTASHAELSAGIMGLSSSRYKTIPVGTNEQVSKNVELSIKNDKKFQVIYYGSMLPLHGIGYVIRAAFELKDTSDIEFLLIGGSDKLQENIQDAISKGANIVYKKWVPFEQLSQVIADADVCLAGPFGDTVQSEYIITGKAYHFLSMKKTCIIGENKESHIFTDKKNALVVGQASATELAKAVKWSFDNRSKLPDIGRAGYKLYQSKLSNKVIARQIKELLSIL